MEGEYESYHSRREREREDDREERRRYEADVYYDVWRSGKNPDAIDFDRVDDNRHDGMYSDEAARIEINAQRRRHQSESEDGFEYEQ